MGLEKSIYGWHIRKIFREKRALEAGLKEGVKGEQDQGTAEKTLWTGEE